MISQATLKTLVLPYIVSLVIGEGTYNSVKLAKVDWGFVTRHIRRYRVRSAKRAGGVWSRCGSLDHAVIMRSGSWLTLRAAIRQPGPRSANRRSAYLVRFTDDTPCVI